MLIEFVGILIEFVRVLIGFVMTLIEKLGNPLKFLQYEYNFLTL